MANFAETALLEARVLMKEDVEKKFNQRPQISNINKAYLAGREYVTGEKGESLEELRQATTQTTKLKYITRQTFTPTTVKTCTPSGDLGDSGNVTVTWNKLVRTIKLRYKQFDGNEIKAANWLRNVLWQMENDILTGASGLDAAMLAHLEANRTYVNAISAGGSENTWQVAPLYEVQVANGDVNRFYNYVLADMARNNYTGMFHDIHDVAWTAERAYYAMQGTANSVNTAFQFDGFQSLQSNLIVPGAYSKSTHYVVPEGGVAVGFWNEQQNMKGAGNEFGVTGKWDVQQSMLLPEAWYDVFIKSSCADTTSYGGSAQDLVQDIEFTLNYALIKMPLDVTNETPIFKYNVLTT